MSDVALAFRQVKYENKSFWRNPASMFFTFIFPLMFLVIFNLLFGGKVHITTGQTVNASYFYVPAIAAFSIVTACFTNTAMSITLLRDQGVLKRSQGSPLPGWAFLLGRIMFAVIIAILLVLIVTAAGVLFYNVNAPTDTIGLFVLSVIVGVRVSAHSASRSHPSYRTETLPPPWSMGSSCLCCSSPMSSFLWTRLPSGSSRWGTSSRSSTSPTP